MREQKKARTIFAIVGKFLRPNIGTMAKKPVNLEKIMNIRFNLCKTNSINSINTYPLRLINKGINIVIKILRKLNHSI